MQFRKSSLALLLSVVLSVAACGGDSGSQKNTGAVSSPGINATAQIPDTVNTNTAERGGSDSGLEPAAAQTAPEPIVAYQPIPENMYGIWVQHCSPIASDIYGEGIHRTTVMEISADKVVKRFEDYYGDDCTRTKDQSVHINYKLLGYRGEAVIDQWNKYLYVDLKFESVHFNGIEQPTDSVLKQFSNDQFDLFYFNSGRILTGKYIAGETEAERPGEVNTPYPFNEGVNIFGEEEEYVEPPLVYQYAGRVAMGGYLSGVYVCIDSNVNLVCEFDEPGNLSNESGEFQIGSTEFFREINYVAEIPAGSFNGFDNKTTAYAVTLTGSMSSSRGFMGPLSTLEQQYMADNSEFAVSVVEGIFESELGISDPNLFLFADYLKIEPFGSATPEAKYRTMLSAQLLGQLIMNIQRTTIEAASNSGLDLLSDTESRSAMLVLVNRHVLARLDEVGSAVENHINEYGTDSSNAFDSEQVALTIVPAGYNISVESIQALDN